MVLDVETSFPDKENNTIKRAASFIFEHSCEKQIVIAVFIIDTKAMITILLASFAASGKMSGDGEIASVMGFSGFGMCSPAQIVKYLICLVYFSYNKLAI